MSLEYTQKITLDLESNSAYTTVSAKSSDQNSRALDIYIQKNGQDYVFQDGSLLQFRLKKPDGTSVIMTEDIDKYTDEQGIEHPLLHRTSSDPAIIHLIFSGQCLAAAGRGYADIVETLDSSNQESNDIQIISTVSFILNIMSSPDMSGLISENEFAVILKYVHEAQEAATSASTSASIAIENANTASESALQAINNASIAYESAIMAIQSANIASDNANIAVGAASNALRYTSTAKNSAIIATNSAAIAINNAFTASNSAVIALDSASIAIQQANIATESASTAISNASIAIEQADIATSMASNANQSMQSAQQYANVASSSAANAQSYASSASSSAYYASQSADLASASAVIAVNAASSAQRYMDIASASAYIATDSAAIAINSAMIAFNSAANASQSAVDAAIYATTASGSAVIALQSAIDARSYAATASDSAYISTTNALIASNSAAIATSSAAIATSSANTAIEQANVASESALQATNSASIAYESAGIAISSASIALNSANIASDSATIAIDNAVIALNSANIASDSAGIALNSAAISTSSAATAVGKAEDAEAWSVGQRNGMDVDQSDITYHNNAKYWAGQAQHASGERAPIDSPSFTGIPTTPNVAVGTSTSQIANTKYVMDSIAALGEVMVFKGIVNQNSDLPATHSIGWTYKVGTAGTYVGVVCEVGDTIVCINNGTSANNNDWYVLQANIDGVVIGPTGSTDGHVVIFDGSSGKLIKDGYGVATSISNSSNTIPTTEAVYTGLNSKQDTLTFDNSPVQNSNNPVRSGGIYNALNSKQDTLVFDSTPSDGSTNPVTSEGIYTALSNKQNKITANGVLQGNGSGSVMEKVVDTTPTINSENLVSSGGVASAIAAVCGFAQAVEIPSNSDLNDYTSPGVFYCASGTIANTLSNTPITNAGFTMFVNPSSTIGLPTQFIICSVSTLTRIFIRRKYNTTAWYEWISPTKITGATETTFNGVLAGNGETVTAKAIDSVPVVDSSNLITSGGVKSALTGLSANAVAAPGGDWNAIDRTGFFSGNVNSPGNNAYALGMAIRLNTTGSNFSMLQIATTSSTGITYFREKTPGDQSSGWSAWKELVAKSALDAFQAKNATVLSHVSLNTITTGGSYCWYTTTSSDVTDAPTTTAAGMLVIYPGSGDGCYQICIVQNGSTYFRYRSSATAQWTEWVELATKADVDELPYINQNLLCNGYWNGIGSQAGAGNFPINTRGSLNYSAGQYTIDRWYLYNAGYVRINFQGTGIGVRLESTTSAAAVLRQAIPVDGLKGKNVTLSLYNAVTNYGDTNIKVTIGLGNDSTGGVSSTLAQVHIDQVTQLTVTIPANTQYKYLAVYIYLPARATTGNAILLQACKLEIGDKSTLGEWNGTEFVFRDPPPDYAFEVARCRTDVTDSTDTKANDSFAFASDLKNIMPTSFPAASDLPFTPTENGMALLSVAALSSAGGTYMLRDNTAAAGIVTCSANANGYGLAWFYAIKGHTYLMQSSSDPYHSATIRMFPFGG